MEGSSSATPASRSALTTSAPPPSEAVLYKEFGITAEAVAPPRRRPSPRRGAKRARRGNSAKHKAKDGRNAVTMTDVLGELTQAGVSVWLDDISRERLRTGNLAGPDQGLPRARRDVQPDDLRRTRSPRATRTTSRSRTWPSAASTVDEASRMITTYDIRWARRRAAPGLRRLRRRRRPGVDRGRPAAGPRHRQDHRRGQAAVVAGRPAQHVHQDPGDRRRASPRSPRRSPRASAST